MPQPMQNLEDSSDPTTAMNKALALLLQHSKTRREVMNGNGINGNPISDTTYAQEEKRGIQQALKWNVNSLSCRADAYEETKESILREQHFRE
ncbi:hypothetical protein Tco_0115338 [Tanacetum coccineum]